jgi:(R,R)-butanediol dehydrogenase/meso-butanediol dehydrogenase/diacetyl reductase
VAGHEYSGEVVEVGSGVTRLKKGDFITALTTHGCGRCDNCKHGVTVLCSAPESVMGGYGELLRVPEPVAVKLPATLSLADGTLIEPLAVGLHGVKMATMTPGDRVLVLGGGAVALCTIYWARRLGAGRIVAVSRSQRRADMAIAMGADAFVQSGENEIGEVIEALGGSPDAVFECVGAAGLLGQAINHVRTYGQVLSMGFCTAPDAIIPAIAAWKAVRLSFPLGYTLKDFEYIAGVLDSGHVDPRMIVTATIDLAALPATFEALRGPNTETKVQVRLS